MRTKTNPERDKLADELAGLRAEIKALREEKSDVAERNKLRREVEDLKLEKDKLVEANDRKIRDTEHKVGLLKTKQDQDIAHAKRQTELEVREGNLAAKEAQFKSEMTFQREHMQREVDRFDGIAKALMERLPTIEVELTGPARTASRKAADS